MRAAPERYLWIQAGLVLLLFAAGAAGCSSNIGAGPCTGNSPDPACETECDVDGDCPSGFYCGDDGTCTADCTQGGGECGPGSTCDGRGHCVAADGDGGLGPDGSCPNVEVALTPQTPTVMLLIDRSGSMTTDFDNGLDRWEAVQDALTDPTDGVVTQLESDVIFGATLYNSEGGGTVPDECPILHSVDPSLDNSGAINTLFSNYGPSSDTPTAESVDQTVASFPQAEGPRLIVLATDGDPDNCADNDAHNEESQMLTETAVQNAYDQGIETFVLSVGNEVTEEHLQRVANAGQGAPLDSGTETFYVANNQQQMIDAFDQILTGARTCEIDLNGSVDLDKADEGVVILNGTELEHGTDWQMVDGDTLELIGGACDTFLETPNVDLEATFPCGTVIL